MGICDVAVHFDKEDAEYQGDDTLLCTVEVKIHEDADLVAIHLHAFWETHGTGRDLFGGDIHKAQLSEKQKVRAGDVLTFEATFKLPMVPLSYVGDAVNLTHYIEVDVVQDKFFFAHNKHRESYTVLPKVFVTDQTEKVSEENEFLTETPTESLKVRTNKDSSSSNILEAIFDIPTTGSNSDGCLWAILIIILIAVLYYIVIGIGRLRLIMLRNRLGHIDVKIPDDVIYSDTKVPVIVKVTPRKDVSVRDITLNLRGGEISYHIFNPIVFLKSFGLTNLMMPNASLGFPSATWMHQNRFVLSGESILKKGEEYIFETLLDVPDAKQFSYNTGTFHTHWDVALRIDMPWFPDWDVYHTLRLLPKSWQFMKSDELDVQEVGTDVPTDSESLNTELEVESSLDDSDSLNIVDTPPV